MSDPITLQGKDILVSAGAGTGKTYTLKKRVAFELSNQYTDLRRMLILTFTNAAAASMRAKIAQELKEAVNNSSDVKKKQILQEQLRYIPNADIVTFDSFNNSLIKKYFYYIPGFKKDFSIVTGGVLNQVLTQIIDEIFEEKIKEKDPDFLSLLEKYTFDDDKSIRELVQKGVEIAQDRADPIGYLDHLSKIANQFTPEMEHILDEYENSLVRQYKNKVKDYLAFISDNLNGNACFGRVYELYSQDPYAYSLDGTVEEVHGRIKPLLDVKKKSKEPEDDVAKEYKDKIKGKVNETKKAYENALKRRPYIKTFFVRQTPERQYLYSLIKLVWKRFKEFKEKNNVFEFIDINHYALDLLRTNSIVLDEVASSYDEIMVDEYQDNNDLQEEFVSLIKSSPCFKGTLFMVGDVKQSIYAFRNAVPQNFVNRFDRYSEGRDNGELCSLLKNFRSCPNVLNYVNKAFSLLMVENFGGINYERDHQILAGNGAYLKVSQKTRVITYTTANGKSSANREAEIIAEDILKRIENHETVTLLDKNGNTYEKELDFSSFALIADRGSSFADVAKIFRQKGIPLIVQQDEKETESIIISLLKNLIILACNIAQIQSGKESLIFEKDEFLHAYLSLARGPYHYDEDKLNSLFAKKQKRDFSQDEIYLQVKEVVDKCRGNTISYLYQKLSCDLKVLNWIKELPQSSIDYRFFLAFTGIVDNLTTLGYDWNESKDFFLSSRFDEDLQSKYNISTASTSKSVTLINMHKSKGLQYPICYFYQLCKQYNEKDSKSPFNMDKDLGIFLPFVEVLDEESEYFNYLKDKQKDKNKNYLKIASDQYNVQKDRAENIRKLYVALTRAEYQINLVRFKDDKYEEKDLKDYNRLQDLLDYVHKKSLGIISPFNEVEIDFDDKMTRTAKRENALTPVTFTYGEKQIDSSKYAKVHTTASKGEADSSTISTAALEFGSRVHEALQATDFHTKDVSFIPEKKIQDMVLSFLNSPFYQQYKDYDIYKEYHYLDGNKEGSVDLLLLSEEKAIIIDYKLKHIDDADYDKQLNIYRSQIQHRFPEKEVECYLYAITTSEIKKVDE